MYRFIITGLLLLSWSVSSQAIEPVSYSGTWANAAYFNKSIDVISESVDIDIIEDTNDSYTVTYELYNNREGLQFPLVLEVFDGLDSFEQSDDFKISIDGQSVPVEVLAEGDTVLDTADFYYPTTDTGDKTFRAESKYINVNLPQGLHTVIATYEVHPHYYGSDWTARHTYSYSLKPMQQSDVQNQRFQGSTVTLNFDGDTDHVTVDIDNEETALPVNQPLHFNDNLAKEIDFVIQKPLNPLARVLTAASPFVAFIALLVIGIRHLRMMSRRAQAQPESLWVVMLTGGFLVPFLSLMVYYIFLLLTDMVIGKGATGESRDLFFVWVLPLMYIILTPIYLVISFVAFISIKRKNIKKLEPSD
ncbi:hypothetical protein [Psychrobacter sp.]|uniref:hypothetical protein n=1 Tax=Psychrobacter sp. TaxID=56811 RepID=UPI003F9ADEB6